MLENFSKRMAAWLIKAGMLKDDDAELYGYAIQYLLLIIIPTTNFTAYCIATHNILNGLITIFSFLLIRKYSGGYHCQSSFACLFLSTITLILIVWLATHISSPLCITILSVSAETELCLNGPVISRNHAVSEKERRLYHKHLICIIILLDIILGLAAFFQFNAIFNCICIVIIVCAISHIACMIGKEKELYY